MRVIQLTVQMLEETHTAQENAQPSQLKGRMLFTSTYNVINCGQNYNEEVCKQSATRVLQPRPKTLNQVDGRCSVQLMKRVVRELEQRTTGVVELCSTMKWYKKALRVDTPEVRCSGPLSEGRAHKVRKVNKTLYTLHRGPELCGNAVEDTSRRQPAQHPLSSGIVVQQQRHGACNNLNQKADILRLVQVCRVTRWSEILGVESYFVGRVAIVWHVLGTTTIYLQYTSMSDDFKAEPKSVIGYNTTCEPILDASITRHNSRFVIEESNHLLVKDG